jgi:hypothetical protein
LENRCNPLLTLHLQPIPAHEAISLLGRSPRLALNLFTRVLRCWNWKYALLSATVRSLVYLVAMAHGRVNGGPANGSNACRAATKSSGERPLKTATYQRENCLGAPQSSARSRPQQHY